MTALIVIFGILLFISVLSTLNVIEIPASKLTGHIGVVITAFIIYSLAKTELFENYTLLVGSNIAMIIYLVILYKNRKKTNY